MADKNTSTLQSVLDSATSSIQSAVGAITGNPADKKAAQDTQAKADIRDAASHATAKVGPVTVTPDGAATDNTDRTKGSWNQTLGSGKEALGGLIGSENLKQQGSQQRREGEEQEARGQLNDLGQGIKDRVTGTVGSAVSAVTGDRLEEDKYRLQHDEGKARQRGVEADLQKQQQTA